MHDSTPQARRRWDQPLAVLIAGALIAAAIGFAGERIAAASERKLTGCLAFFEAEVLARHDAPTAEQRERARRSAGAACYK